MNVSLTPHFEEFIQALVGSGKYNSASEVVRDALRLLQEKHNDKKINSAVLQEFISLGLESGESQNFDLEEFLTQANQAYKTRKSH